MHFLPPFFSPKDCFIWLCINGKLQIFMRMRDIISFSMAFINEKFIFCKKKLHVNVIFSPIILNVIFLFHYLFKIKKNKYVASYDFNLTSAWPTIQKHMHALKYRKTTHITVFLIEFDKFNRMLSSAHKITMNQIINDFNFSQF